MLEPEDDLEARSIPSEGSPIRQHRSVSASQSFTPEQVKLLETVLKGLLTSGSPLAQNASLPSLIRKVATMKKRIDAMKGV